MKSNAKDSSGGFNTSGSAAAASAGSASAVVPPRPPGPPLRLPATVLLPLASRFLVGAAVVPGIPAPLSHHN